MRNTNRGHEGTFQLLWHGTRRHTSIFLEPVCSAPKLKQFTFQDNSTSTTALDRQDCMRDRVQGQMPSRSVPSTSKKTLWRAESHATPCHFLLLYLPWHTHTHTQSRTHVRTYTQYPFRSTWWYFHRSCNESLDHFYLVLLYLVPHISSQIPSVFPVTSFPLQKVTTLSRHRQESILSLGCWTTDHMRQSPQRISSFPSVVPHCNYSVGSEWHKWRECK